MKRGKLRFEGRWLRIYQTGPRHEYLESKFLTDGLEIDAEALIAEWNSLSSKERWEFGMAFGAKATLTDEDEKVLNYLMGEDGKDVWFVLPSILTRHPDRTRVVQFLAERIRNETSYKANYYQALGTMKAADAESLLRQQANDFETEFPVSLEAPRTKLLDYIVCIESLFMITQRGSLKEKLIPLQSHSDSTVQVWVRKALEAKAN